MDGYRELLLGTRVPKRALRSIPLTRIRLMANNSTPAGLVRHRLQIHFDFHECRLTNEALNELADDADSLARQVGNFPVADLRVVVELKTRTNEYVVKLTLLLSGETLVTSDHDPVVHAAFERALASLEDLVKEYKDRLNQTEERRKREAGTFQEVVPSTPVDLAALDAAARAGDYPAYRAAVAAYEDPLRLRVGRWVERYPAVQGRMGRGLETIDLVESAFLTAFEAHETRPEGVRYGDWLETLLDPVVREFEHHPDEELENVNMARAACAAG
jgi:ribosome-associated translation inhibitor RaiA